MKALITLNGLAIAGQYASEADRPKSLMVVEYVDEKLLVTKLKELQSGYSLDGRDKPRIKKHQIPSKRNPGKMRKIIDCSTQADWHHVAHINVSSTNPLIQTITL